MFRPFVLLLLLSSGAHAQAPAAPPPAVGVVAVEMRAVTETSEFVGRVQAVERVEITARVTAVIEARLFDEGAEVKAGVPLYRLERAPFEAAVAQQDAAVAQTEARVDQTDAVLTRVQALMTTPSGLRSALDDARGNHLAAVGALQGAQALQRVARINLGYTEIAAPIAGKIARGNVSVGNVVGPGTGSLTSIVSQDPMNVTFPVGVRALLRLDERYRGKGGMAAVAVRVRLPDGRAYGPEGKIDYQDPTIVAGTDSILLRARIPNPERQLIDGEFVTVIVAGIEPVAALAIPRAAVLADVQGNYVYVVAADNKVERRPIKLGQSTAETAVIVSGLSVGEMVISDGMQRARPGLVVNPGPAAPLPRPTAAPVSDAVRR